MARLEIGDRVRHDTYGVGTVVEPSLPGNVKVGWDHYYDRTLGDFLASSEWDCLANVDRGTIALERV